MERPVAGRRLHKASSRRNLLLSRGGYGFERSGALELCAQLLNLIVERLSRVVSRGACREIDGHRSASHLLRAERSVATSLLNQLLVVRIAALVRLERRVFASVETRSGSHCREDVRPKGFSQGATIEWPQRLYALRGRWEGAKSIIVL